MAARPALAAAAGAIWPLLTGPARTGAVLGSFSRALITGLPGADGPQVVSLLGNGAAGVPNGVRISGGPVSFGAFRGGDPVTVGDGCVRLGDLQIRVVRSWSSRVPRIRPAGAGISALAAAAQRAELGVPPEPVAALERAVTSAGARDPADPTVAVAVAGLVGLGPGLTPGGDDVLTGLMAALHACGRADLAHRIGAAARPGIAQRTTALSADLLRLAADGHAFQEALLVLRELHRGGRPDTIDGAPDRLGAPLQRAIGRLLSIGHTSGAGLATGLAMGLRCGTSAPTGGPPAGQEVR